MRLENAISHDNQGGVVYEIGMGIENLRWRFFRSPIDADEDFGAASLQNASAFSR